MRPTEPTDLAGLQRSIEKLIKSQQLLNLSRHPDVSKAKRQPDQVTLDQLFEHASLLQRALHHPESAYTVLAAAQARNQEYQVDVLETEILRGQSGDLERDHTMRGVILASEYQLIARQSQGLLRADDRKVREAAQSGVRRLLSINQRVARSYAQPLDGVECGRALDVYASELLAHASDDQFAGLHSVLFANLRNEFCRRFAGADYDGRRVEDYRGDGLLGSRSLLARASVLNNHNLSRLQETRLGPEYARQIDAQLSDEPTTDLYTAALDPTADQHRDAKRILTKLVIAGGLTEMTALLTHVIANGNAVQEPPADYQKFGQLLTGEAAEQRFKAVQALLDACYGATGVKAVRDYVFAFRRHATGARLDRIDVPATRPLTGWAPQQYPHEDKPYWRINKAETLTAATAPEEISLVEQVVEQLPAVRDFQAAMIKDILESTVALNGFQMILPPDILVAVQPVADRYPAVQVTWSNDEKRFQFELDEQLQLATETPKNPLCDAMRAVVIAGLHDQLSINTITTRSVRTTTESKPTKSNNPEQPDSTQPNKPVRIHPAGNFIVTLSEPADPAEVTHHITAVDDSSIKLTVERRAHWADLAPQLTMQSRQQALDRLLAEQPDCVSAEEQHLLRRVILQPGSHRLSLERIITDLLANEQRGKRLLDNSRPWHQLLERLQELEAEIYDEALQHYVGVTSNEPQGPLPKILTMASRMQSDATAQAARGTTQSIPMRTKPTQTYVPSARYEYEVPMRERGVAKTKQYTIMRGKSAVEALWQILNPGV
jgi:hypothetical protein